MKSISMGSTTTATFVIAKWTTKSWLLLSLGTCAEPMKKNGNKNNNNDDDNNNNNRRRRRRRIIIIVIALFNSLIILATQECSTNWRDCKPSKSNQMLVWFIWQAKLVPPPQSQWSQNWHQSMAKSTQVSANTSPVTKTSTLSNINREGSLILNPKGSKRRTVTLRAWDNWSSTRQPTNHLVYQPSDRPKATQPGGYTFLFWHESTKHCHPLPCNTSTTVDDIMFKLEGAIVFSVLHMNEGYHQLELDEDTRHLTTFYGTDCKMLYTGRNCGTISAQDIFNKAMDGTIVGLSVQHHIRYDFSVVMTTPLHDLTRQVAKWRLSQTCKQHLKNSRTHSRVNLS